MQRKGRENWLRLREKQGPSQTIDEIQAQGREKWLRLRRQLSNENSPESQDRSAERERESPSKELSSDPDYGHDDEMK
jgi:hypothetical protein